MTPASAQLSAAAAPAPGLEPLLALGRMLQGLDYQFTTGTPTTHQLVNSRPENRAARSLRDVFGWSRPFPPGVLPPAIFEATRTAAACEPVPGAELWRPRIRFSTLGGLIFAHSAFPTSAQDAVFFGPDSYRFVRAVEAHALAAQRVVDVGCGTGVGGIALAKRGIVKSPVVLTDISVEALRFAELNAALNAVPVETVESDVLAGVKGEFDLVIANPPYLRDHGHRLYRDGGGGYGEALALRIVGESIERLRAMPEGGRLLLYTGAAVVDGVDTFLHAVRDQLARPGVRYSYEELDPDVFSEELQEPAYANVERIAAVFLQVKVSKQ